MPGPKFTADYDETMLILEIVKRAVTKHPGMFSDNDFQNLAMDLDATHSNGCPLDFEKLLEAPPFDFAHDLAGISNHINRETGKLGDCFLPRCAKPEDC